MGIATPTSVIAQTHNENSYQEGDADAALDPGQGCVPYKDANGEWQVRAANANEDTKRVVREQRNPPRGGMTVTDTGTSPLDDGYSADDHVETVGFHRYDRGRCRVSQYASGDPTDAEVGWDEDGNITDNEVDAGATALDTPVGRGIELIERTDEDDLLIVEFY